MGLFGGFKAKFTRNGRSKETKSQTGVVALNFKLKSEFDTSIPSSASNGAKPVPNRTKIRPELPMKFEEINKSLRDKLKSKSVTNLSDGHLIETQPKPHIQKSNSLKEPSVLIEYKYNKINTPYEGDNTTVEKSNSVKEQRRTPPAENFIYMPPTESVHQYEQITGEHFDTYEDDTPSTLIMMTQHAPDDLTEKSKTILKTSGNSQNISKIHDHNYNKIDNDHDRKDASYDYVYDIKQVNSNEPAGTSHVPEDIYGEEDFKINIVQHNRSYVSEDEVSYTEDEVSYTEDENPPGPTNYSSQATSIFFGSAAPTITRPRKVAIKRDDDNDENDEMDC